MVADPTYGRVLLSPLVPRFLEAFAHVPLEVALDAQQLAEGAWDVAIRTRPPADATRRAAPARRAAGAAVRDPGLPAAARRSRERPDELRSHDLLTPDAAELPQFRLQLARGAQRAEVPLAPKLAVDDPAVLHAATAAGLGIGLLPEFLCRQGLATGRLKAVLAEWTVPPAAALYARLPGGARVRPARAAVRGLPGGEHRAGAGAAGGGPPGSPAGVRRGRAATAARQPAPSGPLAAGPLN